MFESLVALSLFCNVLLLIHAIYLHRCMRKFEFSRAPSLRWQPDPIEPTQHIKRMDASMLTRKWNYRYELLMRSQWREWDIIGSKRRKTLGLRTGEYPAIDLDKTEKRYAYRNTDSIDAV